MRLDLARYCCSAQGGKCLSRSCFAFGFVFCFVWSGKEKRCGGSCSVTINFLGLTGGVSVLSSAYMVLRSAFLGGFPNVTAHLAEFLR